MDQSLVNWTHWFEFAPGGAIKCIIIKEYYGLFMRNSVKILDSDGYAYTVNKRYLISMK
jgi:hypothetical protein